MSAKAPDCEREWSSSNAEAPDCESECDYSIAKAPECEREWSGTSAEAPDCESEHKSKSPSVQIASVNTHLRAQASRMRA